MLKCVAYDRRAAVVFALATAAMAGSAASVAGPGCMGNQQPMARGYYPGGPMMPQAAHRPGPPAAYRAGPTPYMGIMAPPPYQRPMAAQRGNPNAVAPPAAAAPVDTIPVSSKLHAASSGSEPAGENITVRISGMRFEPSSVTVKPGTTVTWIHGSSMPHTITGNADGLRSSTLYGGQQYSYTFDATGRYDYACDFHPSMKGSVIVETSGRDT